MTTLFRALRAFSHPKEGHSPDEYEDAVAGDPTTGRFAIADGASESAFAASWARLLVKGHVRNPGPWSVWLPAARQRWLDKTQAQELPWYAEAKFQEGAFATLLGIAFKGRRWRARAVGDSCLFVVRGQRLLRAFPMRRASDFGNQPTLLGSRRTPGQTRVSRLRLQGDCQPGDVFLLMTDALAQWFLKKTEERGSPWNELQALADQAQFVKWMGKLRAAREMRNDDVTLLCLQLRSS